MKQALQATFLSMLMALSAAAQTNQPAASPGARLVWNSEHQETNVTATQATADYVFSVTNVSETEVIIERVNPSCSCTSAKMPSQPWHLPPHAHGDMQVSVNLLGKAGTFDKTVGVFFSNSNMPPQFLRVTVKMPDRNIMRGENTKIAAADRQAVFKGDCAKCHADPAKVATGHNLYALMCGICHNAKPRASMVPDLRLINHPTDLEFWKTNIANGKPGTMMPAFAKSQGGPLTDAQIEDIAKDCVRGMPYIPRTDAELKSAGAGTIDLPAPKPAGATN